MEHRRVGRRRQAAHRAGPRHGRRGAPRYGRILMLAGSLVLTVTAAGAAAGFVPHAGDGERPASTDESVSGDDAETRIARPSLTTPATTPEPSRGDPAPRRLEHGDPSRAPADSGHGRRAVYDISDQRVWLVEANGAVRRSYLVSGSVMHNLRPGSYQVYSRSLHAVAFDQQSTMDYMVRFAEGDNAPIGFHNIPEDLDGQPLQTAAKLGTPQSHGCIRQRLADARVMWRFGTIDTPVRVLA